MAICPADLMLQGLTGLEKGQQQLVAFGRQILKTPFPDFGVQAVDHFLLHLG